MGLGISDVAYIKTLEARIAELERIVAQLQAAKPKTLSVPPKAA